MTPIFAPAPRPRILREQEFWLLLGATLLFFGLPVLWGRTYFLRDLYFWSFPQRAHIAETVRTGRLPLWDPLIYGGQPLLGNIQYSALYPTAVLSLVMPAVTAVNLEIVLHFALCAAAAYALARYLGLTPLSSALAGVVFAFSGVTLSFGNLLGRLLAMPSTVLLLLFWHRYLQERRRTWFALAAVSGALPLFAGSAEQFVFSLSLAAAWGAVYPYPKAAGSRERRLLLALPLALAVLGLSAVQTLPMRQIVQSSRRGSSLPAAERGDGSVNPRRLPELLVPGFFGDTDTLRESDYWGAAAEDMRFPIVLSIYFGATVLVLAGRAAFWAEPGPLPRGCRRLLGGVLFGSMVLSLGRFIPTGGLFDPTLVLGFFRFPVKFFFATPLPAALLAAHEMDSIRFSEVVSRARRAVAMTLASAALLLLLTAACLLWSGRFSEAFQRVFFLQAAQAAVRGALALRVMRAAIFAGAAAAVLARRGSVSSARAPALLCALVGLDLATAGRRLNPTAPRQLLTRPPKLAHTVRDQIGDGRFFRDAHELGLTLRAPSNELRWRYEWNRETLADYTAAGFGIPLIFQESFDGLDSARHALMTRTLRVLPWSKRLPLLSAASVRAFVTAEDVTADGVDRIGEVSNTSDRAFHLYRNARAARPAELVHFWHAAASPDEAIHSMAVPGFDPRRHAVLEGSVPAPPPGPCTSPVVQAEERGETARSWRTTASCEGYLVLSELNDPGWQTLVDGRRASVLWANGMFSAVFVPAGEHRVRRVYRPAPLRAGAAVSLCSLGILLGVTLRARRHRHAAHDP